MAQNEVIDLNKGCEVRTRFYADNTRQISESQVAAEAAALKEKSGANKPEAGSSKESA